MLQKLSIKVRLTVLSVLLLIICCIGLTATLNISAYQMANVIEAIKVSPAISIKPDETYEEQIPAVGLMATEKSQISQKARVTFLNKSIFFMALVVIVGGALTYYIVGKTLEPLQELSRQMKNKTVHNLSEDLPMPHTNDEIADLTVSFNEMSSKLNEAFAMQKRFSQSAAHELRTPLAVLKTKVAVFKKKDEHTAQEYDNLLSVITSNTNRLSDLVSDLLNLTNLDTLDCNEQISIKQLLFDIIEELQCISKEQEIKLTLTGKENMILGNKNLLHRAFYNLIENAIKYNQNGGYVNINITNDTNKSIITIVDNGIGIPQSMREMIFEPFFRVDKSRSRKIGGSGLGLTTVKSIIDMHNGKIEVLGNANGGTIFKVIIKREEKLINKNQ